MPTNEELEELGHNCKLEWTKYKSVRGYMLTSKKNGKKLFLPASGCRNETSLNYAGENGYCWSSTPLEEFDNGTIGLGFSSGPPASWICPAPQDIVHTSGAGFFNGC